MSGRTRITLPDGKAVYEPSDDASDRLRAWFQDRLQAFHGHVPRPTCGCQHAGRPLDLVIRRLASGRLILVRMPNEGPLHRESCDFNSQDTDRSGQAGYVKGVITEADDGGYIVRLELGLSIRGNDPQPVAVAPVSGRPGAGTQRAMTALGLLHALWEAAQLDRWHPGFAGKRKAGLVAWRLGLAADQFRVVRTELESVFVATAPDRDILADQRGVPPVRWCTGPLAAGAADLAPFDLIVIDGAVATIPAALAAQLRPGGRVVSVIAPAGGVSRAAIAEASGAGLRPVPLFDAAVAPIAELMPAPGFVL